MAAITDVPNHVVAAETKKSSTTRGLNQKFLDYFWKLAEPDPNTRLEASLEIIKCVNSSDSTVSQKFNFQENVYKTNLEFPLSSLSPYSCF